MRKIILASALMTTISAPSVTLAIEMTDYIFPDSEYQEAYLRANFDSNTGNQDQTSYSYSLTGEYEAFFSTLKRTWQLNLDGTASGDRGPNEGDELNDWGALNISTFVDNYFQNDNKLFWYGSGEANYNSEASDAYPNKSDAKDTRLHVGAGIGFGRVFVATPLARALRVVDELDEKGSIAAPVSDKTYLDLAHVIDKQTEYRSRYGDEEYKAPWFSAMEEIMIRDKMLKDGRLGAGGALDMDRVLVDEVFSARKHGWLVRAGLGVLVQDYSGETDNDPTFDAMWEYAKPFGHKGQFDNILTYQTVFASDTDQVFRNKMSYTYEVSDRIDWVNNWDITYFIPGDNELDNTLTNVLSSGFDYYLTNRLTAGILITLSHIDDGVDDNDFPDDVNNDDVEITTAFGIKYRFL